MSLIKPSDIKPKELKHFNKFKNKKVNVDNVGILTRKKLIIHHRGLLGLVMFSGLTKTQGWKTTYLGHTHNNESHGLCQEPVQFIF